VQFPIKLPISAAVLGFLVLTVAFVLVLWVLFGWRRRGKLFTPDTGKHVWKCPICSHVYLETRPEGGLSKCPQCGSMNTDDEAEKVDLKERGGERAEDE
jgi:hypothetical protein